jgi:hypothetical protein
LGDSNNQDKIFIGMFREDFHTLEWRTRGGYVQCSCGHICQTKQALFDHWQSGHFDQPVHKDWEEVAFAIYKKGGEVVER